MKRIIPWLALLPTFVFASDGANLDYFDNLVVDIGALVAKILPVVIALGLLFFLWGLAVFILNAGNEDKREEGKKIMIWGVIALFFMVSVWGLVSFLQGITGVDSVDTLGIPGIPGVAVVCPEPPPFCPASVPPGCHCMGPEP